MNCIKCNSTKVLHIESYFANIVHVKDPDTHQILDTIFEDLELNSEHYQCDGCDKWYQLDEFGKIVIHQPNKKE